MLGSIGRFLQRARDAITGGNRRKEEEERRRQETQLIRPTSPPQQIQLAPAPTTPAPPSPPSLEQQVSDSYGTGRLQRSINRLRDIFDANTEADYLRRQAADEQGRRLSYADQERERGVYNPRENLAEHLLAAPVRTINTAKAGLGGAYGLGLIAKESVLGDDESYKRRTREVQETLRRDLSNNAGLFGYGSLFADSNEAANISAADLTKRIVGTGLESGSMAVGGVGVGRVLGTGAQAGTRLLTREGVRRVAPDLLLTSLSEGLGSAGQELGENRNATPGSTASAAATGLVTGPLFGLSGYAGGRLFRGGVNLMRRARGLNHYGEVTKLPVSSVPSSDPLPNELSAGVGSPNPDFIPANQLQLADNTPAFRRGIPETVGEADLQARQGQVNLPDSTFDADARLAPVEPGAFGPADLDIPAYIRRSPGAVLTAADNRLAELGRLIQNAEGGIGAEGKMQWELFNRRRQGLETPSELRNRLQRHYEGIDERGGRDLVRALGERRGVDRERALAIEAGADPAVTTPEGAIPTPEALAPAPTPQPVAAQTALEVDRAPAPRSRVPEGAQIAPAVAAPEAPEIPASLATPETPSVRTQIQPGAQSSATAGEGVTAPRTRQQLANRVSDERIQAELMENATAKERQSLAEAQNIGNERVRNLSDDELVSRYSGGKNMERPEDFFEALAAVRRLERMGTDDAVRAAADLMESVTNKSSESGRWNRATQILFEDAPPTLQAEMLLRKLTRAGAEFADATQEAAVRRQLFDKLAEADLLYRGDVDETGAVRARGVLQIRDEAVALAEDVRAGAVSPEAARTRAQELAQEYGELLDQWELKNGEVMDLFEQQLPKDKLGSRIGLGARLAMLSSPAGRAFDVISTSSTMLADTSDRTFSALAAKAVGSQRAKTSLPSLRTVFGEAGSGLKRAKEEWQGARRVSNIWNELDMKTRSDIRKTSGAFSRRIKAMTEAPTLMSEGIRKDELRRIGMQRAKEAGLEGDAAKVYADLYSIGASKADQYAARQEWLKANLLHKNRLSDFFTKVGRNLEQSGLVGSWVKNMIMPFTSFASGNIQRALTDRNVLHNAWKIGEGVKKQNPQMIVDALGKLTTNVAGITAASMILAEAGVLTDKDANDENYDGVYLKFGDRHIPVALTGQFAPMLIGGYALNKALAADNPVEGIADFIGNSAVGIAKSVDMTSMFGGDNALMNRVTDLHRIAVGDDNVSQKVSDLLIRLGGDTVRQYIPSLTGDVNAALDQTSLNPTHEASETEVTKENPKTGNQVIDVPATELAKTKNRIPGLSQTLPRKEGSLAKDPLDRIMKSTRLSDSQKQAQADEKAAQEKSASLAERGVPDHTAMKTIEEFNVAVENLAYDGEFSKAIEGLKNRLADMEQDPSASRNSKEKIRKQITEYEVLSKGNFSMEDLETYQSIGVEDWRKLGDPESEYYNKDAYERLWALDVALAEQKVGGGRGLNKNGQKYSAKKPSTGGRGGGRGGSRSNTIGSPQSLARISLGRLQSRSTSAPKIPTIDRLKPSELVKKRKISVSRR